MPSEGRDKCSFRNRTAAMRNWNMINPYQAPREVREKYVPPIADWGTITFAFVFWAIVLLIAIIFGITYGEDSKDNKVLLKRSRNYEFLYESTKNRSDR